MNDGMRRFLRGGLQIIAGGGGAQLINQLLIDAPDAYDPYITIGGALLGVVAHLALESFFGRDIGVARSGPHGG